MNKPKLIFVSLAGMIMLASLGCGVGNAPAPMSDADAKSSFEHATPENQIKTIQMSAEPQGLKDKQIAVIEAKTGYKPPAGTGLPATQPGTNGVPVNAKPAGQ